jgi:hypothetical protein
MNGFDDFDLFISCEEYYDDAAEFEAKYAEDEPDLEEELGRWEYHQDR